MLVDTEGFDPRAIVVKDETSLVGSLLANERLFVTDEVVVPIAAVKSATHDMIRLSIGRADVRREKPYLSYRFQALAPGVALLRAAELLGGGLAFPSVEEVANKPKSEIEIDRNENVMIGKTGRRLGKVHDVVYDRRELVGVVIRPEGLFKQDVLLPIRFVTRGDDMALFADIDEGAAKELKPFVDQE